MPGRRRGECRVARPLIGVSRHRFRRRAPRRKGTRMARRFFRHPAMRKRRVGSITDLAPFLQSQARYVGFGILMLSSLTRAQQNLPDLKSSGVYKIVNPIIEMKFFQAFRRCNYRRSRKNHRHNVRPITDTLPRKGVFRFLQHPFRLLRCLRPE